MIAILNWSPVGGSNSTGQRVEYKLRSATQWAVFSTIGPTVSTETVTGLEDNMIYDFQVVNLCAYGGPTDSKDESMIKILCPAVTTSKTFESITFSFPALGGDITDYMVELLNNSGVLITSITKSATSGNVSDSFTGLSSNTSFQIRVKPQTAGGTYKKTDCAIRAVTTDPLPTCDAPTNLTVTLS